MECDYEIDGIKLVESCGACPEAYDAFHNDLYCGYFRLRHGRFTVYDTTLEEEIFSTTAVEGDGVFFDHERDKFLTKGVKELKIYLGID
ncbi:hypothetical protein phiOC_p116 [Ochrobactrum phage vB_OspM_OC]|nr:hypothetical protein phiOC_p116 [Ochrobactrum phage vB_OspM_OC]